MPYYFTKIQNWNNVGTAIVGILDIITGLTVYYSPEYSFNDLLPVMFLSFFYLTLGIWSIHNNAMKKNYYDWRGVVDFINGMILLSIYTGNVFDFFRILGLIIIIKGGLCLFLITTKY